jgi:hypothetical protein
MPLLCAGNTTLTLRHAHTHTPAFLLGVRVGVLGAGGFLRGAERDRSAQLKKISQQLFLPCLPLNGPREYEGAAQAPYHPDATLRAGRGLNLPTAASAARKKTLKVEQSYLRLYAPPPPREGDAFCFLLFALALMST